jgi:hypothetical protein
MTRFLLLLTFLLPSCNTSAAKQVKGEYMVEKQFDYRITVNEWNGFFGHGSEFILDNSLINSYDSTQDYNLQIPLTLYHISFISTHQKNETILSPHDTTKIAFSKSLSDTLFLLTKRFFQGLEFNNYDTVGQLMPIITDDSHGFIELQYRGRTLSATISSINNPTIATKELDTLRRFVKKFRPLHE